MQYDLIVLGTGGIGSAALYSGAQRGLMCLGLDRFAPAHDRGSSHGESRLIRQSYFEHPDYVPLLRRSYALWDALDPHLLHRSGGVYCGPPDGEMIKGVLASAREHHLDVQRVDASAYPQYRCAPDAVAVFEPDAGWLPVERCVRTHIDKAVAAGAEHRWGEPVVHWHEGDAGIEVATASERFRARSLVIAGGPWAAHLLSDLSLPLIVQRKHLHWFGCDDPRYRHGFFYQVADGLFYGFPAGDGRLKLAEHSGGEVVDDPLTAHRNLCPKDDARIANFVADYLPGVIGPRVDHATCFYTRTPDEHFIVDRYPGSSAVAFAAGLSGHGFKFAPALGEVLVDLATGVESVCDIDFLSLERESLTAANDASSAQTGR
ncbi:MAG: N-methyl-L-tryptophan oxidase [Congregibacter sp.]